MPAVPRLRLPLLGIQRSDLPHDEGEVRLPGGGRRIGWAAFGDPDGRPVLWFHGTPGGRRQVPPLARQAAHALGLKVIGVDRPGVGLSTDHLYRRVREWSDDVDAVAEGLGLERFGIVALSGGGPYALACAHDLTERVVGVGILGGACPAAGDEATGDGVVQLSRRFNRVLGPIRTPVAGGLRHVIGLALPVAAPGYRAASRLFPPGDRAIMGDPATEAMFIRDLARASHTTFRAVVNDAILFGRHWGFALADVRVPIRWWHGDADPIIPLAQARRAVAALPDAVLTVQPEASHLGGFGIADEVLAEIDRLWSTA